MPIFTDSFFYNTLKFKEKTNKNCKHISEEELLAKTRRQRFSVISKERLEISQLVKFENDILKLAKADN